MKSIKVLLPSALTFMLFLGFNQATAQSSINDPIQNSVLALSEIDGLTKSVGLNYKQTLIDINNRLEYGVKADYGIDFRGKVMVHIDVDASGNISAISFDKEIPSALAETIKSSLIDTDVTPVQLNGKAKAQAFNIPVIIK